MLVVFYGPWTAALSLIPETHSHSTHTFPNFPVLPTCLSWLHVRLIVSVVRASILKEGQGVECSNASLADSNDEKCHP